MFPKCLRTGLQALNKNCSPGFLVLRRNLQHEPKIASEFTEVKIDVPWGQVAGKLWGPENKQPILAVHGLMDNAGSFDPIAPFLCDKHSILAIDLPGNGKSSHLPPGMPYNLTLNAFTIRHIRRHYGWKKIKLMGHSLGGISCFNYGILYPKDLQFMVNFDACGFFPVTIPEYLKKLSRGIDKFIDFEKISGQPPSYPEDVAIKKLVESTIFKSLDEQSARILLIRGANRRDDGTYYFSRDFRVSIEGFEQSFTQKDVDEMGNIIDCPHLLIGATKTPFPKAKEYWGKLDEGLAKNKLFERVIVEGNHHVHMTHPEVVASHLLKFLEKYDT